MQQESAPDQIKETAEVPLNPGDPAFETHIGHPEGPGPVRDWPSTLREVFIGGQGLRAGWSVAIFILLLVLFVSAIRFVVSGLHQAGHSNQVSIRGAFFGELIVFIAMLAAAAIVALIERRRVLDFNLTDPRRTSHFISGIAAGFLALSVLIAGLAGGGWLHFGPVALSGMAVAKYAAAWGCTFLLVGCVEEGLFRCYLQFTLTRGINFWWALAVELLICLDLALRVKGSGVWGVYAVVALGLAPCLLLQLKRSPGAGFWQAAWVTSTLFGFVHTGNNGENWIGIFAAAAIGFVFCVSIWATGSAWWAIGCHAGWDWGETYFYGASDSGLVAPGHYLTSTPRGAALWSGGADGPEGSVLVLAVILLLLLLVLVLYGRARTRVSSTSPAPQVAN